MDREKDNQLTKYESTELSKRDSSSLYPDLVREYDGFDDDSDFNVKTYLDIILRRKWLILACLVISVVTVTVSTLRMVPIYKAQIVVEITPEPPRITSFREVAPIGVQMFDKQEFYETQYQLLKSVSLGKQVVSALGLNENVQTQQPVKKPLKKTGILSKITSVITGQHAKGKGTSENQETKLNIDVEMERKIRSNQIAIGFMGGVTVIPDRKSRLIKITYDSTDPEFAAKAVNTLIDKYIEWIIDRKINTTKLAREFLEDQLHLVRMKLDKSERELGRYAKELDIVGMDEGVNQIYTKLISLNDMLSEVETQRIEKESTYNDVMAGNYKYLPQIINDSTLVELDKKYAELSAQYKSNSVIYGPNFPIMKRLFVEMNKIQEEKNERIHKVGVLIKKDYEASKKKEELLTKRRDDQKKRASLLNEESIQYKVYKRDVETNKTIYQSLLTRLGETEVTSALRATNVQVVDYAIPPTSPYKPNLQSNISYSIFLGLFVGLSLAFILDYFDNTIKDEDEVRRNYGLPFFGAIPLVKEDDSIKLEKIVYYKPKSYIAEAFRVIRTSLLYSSPGHAPKSLLITSSQPIEGKTTVSSNLALSMLQSGSKVVLVDADLRKPRIHSVFLKNGSNTFGLSTYLVGKMDLQGVIKSSDIEGLDIIPSGPIPPNPVELLGSKKMKGLMDELMEKYDHVIVDGPPVTGFADSRIISLMVDGALLVTSVGVTQRHMLKSAIEELHRVRGRILGTVVNRLVPKRSGKYGYGYYYYQQYYTHDESIDNDKKIYLPRNV